MTGPLLASGLAPLPSTAHTGLSFVWQETQAHMQLCKWQFVCPPLSLGMLVGSSLWAQSQQ